MKEKIQSNLAPQPIGIYSQAIKSHHLLFLSGQIPLDPTTNALVSTDFILQAEQVFQNIQTVCQAAGGSLNHIIKLTIYLIDLSHFPIVNEIMARYFQEPYPARTTIAVAGLPKGALIEVEAVCALE